jgi:hypothetical protein
MFANIVLSINLAIFCTVASAQTLLVNQAELEYEIKGDGQNIVFFEAGAISGMSGWDSIWQSLPKKYYSNKVFKERGRKVFSLCG